MLKRSTHAYCTICFTNLEDYGQDRCEGCLLSLKEEGMVTTSPVGESGMTSFRRTRLRIKSLFLRFVGWGVVGDHNICIKNNKM